MKAIATLLLFSCLFSLQAQSEEYCKDYKDKVTIGWRVSRMDKYYQKYKNQALNFFIDDNPLGRMLLDLFNLPEEERAENHLKIYNASNFKRDRNFFMKLLIANREEEGLVISLDLLVKMLISEELELDVSMDDGGLLDDGWGESSSDDSWSDDEDNFNQDGNLDITQETSFDVNDIHEIEVIEIIDVPSKGEVPKRENVLLIVSKLNLSTGYPYPFVAFDLRDQQTKALLSSEDYSFFKGMKSTTVSEFLDNREFKGDISFIVNGTKLIDLENLRKATVRNGVERWQSEYFKICRCLRVAQKQ